MTAEQMFKELGFICRIYKTDTLNIQIQVIKDESNRGGGVYIINFYFDKTYYTNIRKISTNLHKAITKKMEELGWL